MSYINKSIAQNVAFNMLKPTRDKIIQKELEMSDYCMDIVISSIPADEYKLICSIPEGWIELRSSFCFTCDYGYLYITTTKHIRYMAGKNSIKIDKEVFEKVQSMKEGIKSMKDKENQIREQIIATLLRLRTSDRVKKEFPEAFKNLPKESQTSSNIVALPIDKILTSINEFPD